MGSVPKGFPPIGLLEGLPLSTAVSVIPIAFACLVLIVGLAGANLAAGLSGTFVAHGSPTKAKILYDLKGRTQVANLTMAGVVLVDLAGMRYLLRHSRLEFIVALVTAVTVCVVGVTQGTVLAIALSLLNLIRRQCKPRDFVLARDEVGEPVYQKALPGMQSLPGIVVCRLDAELVYANASRFVDDVKAVVVGPPDPVRWLALGCAPVTDLDYSAGMSLRGLLDFAEARDVEVHLVRPDTELARCLNAFDLMGELPPERVHATLEEAFDAFRAAPACWGPAPCEGRTISHVGRDLDPAPRVTYPEKRRRGVEQLGSSLGS